MKTLEYDIRHFPFCRYGAMLSISRNMKKDELIIHDAQNHDGYDSVVFLTFAEERIEGRSEEELKEMGSVPFESVGTPSKLFVNTEKGRAEFVISGDHRIHVHAENLSLVIMAPSGGNDTGCLIDEKHYLCVCPGTRYYRVDSEKGEISVVRSNLHREIKTVVLNPEDGVIDIEVQSAQSPAIVDPVVPLDECVRKTDGEWQAFLEKLPPVPEKYRAYSELAWFDLWSAYVRTQPPFHDDTILMSKKFMTACWSWDHCFNALAVGKADADLGMKQFMAPFYLQQPDGSLPDRFGPDSVLYGISKPPVHGWCMTRLMSWHEYDEQSLKTVYEHMEKWTNWWFDCCTYHEGSLPGYRIGCDSGLDNSTCFDQGEFIESADLSAYLALQMNCLSDIARKLNDEEAAVEWKKRSEALIARMISRLWNGTRMVPRLCMTQEEIGDTESILLYLPLVLGDLLPADIADTMVGELMRNNLTDNGLASEGPNSPKYDPDGYWRGPIWAPTTYLIVDGMRRMGRVDEAREIARRFCDACVDKAHGFYENFDALTGKGLRTPGYTWTASAFLCMVWDFLM